MTSVPDLRSSFGVDLITFFHPAFWHLDSTEELTRRATEDPRWFWDAMLDAVAAAGIDALELTFPPADFRTALRAFGGLDGFQEALRQRSLRVVSHYFSDLESAEHPLDRDSWDDILASAEETARFVASVGGTILVVGLPMRTSRDANPPSFVDLAYAQTIADLLNRVGARTITHGVRTALHVESHSVFWTPRDVDLFMLLTDPMYVAMCPDTGHIALAGADPVDVMNRHKTRLALAHWKDAVGPVPQGLPIDEQIFERQGAYFRRTGTGVIDWFAWTRLLRDIGYNECTLLELDAVPDPVEQMTAAREFVQTALQPLYVS